MFGGTFVLREQCHGAEQPQSQKTLEGLDVQVGIYLL